MTLADMSDLLLALCDLPHGSEEALAKYGEFYLAAERYLATLVARRIRHPQDRDDVLQDIWLRIYQYHRSYRPPQRHEDAAGALARWLARLVANACNDSFNRNNRQGNRPAEMLHLDDDEHPVQAESRFDREDVWIDGMLAAEIDDYVSTLCASLPDGAARALCFKLKFFDGMTIRQASDVAGVPEGTANNWIYRIRAQVLERFQDLAPHPGLT